MRSRKVTAIVIVLVAAAGLASSMLLAAAPGKPPEDFTVFPVGKPFKLSEAKGRYVALHFLLKTECPFCLRYTHEYASKAAQAPGVTHVFLKPDAVEEIAKWVGKTDEKDAVTVHHDEGAKLAKAYGVPDGYAFHGERVHYPALILLGPDGREVFRHVGKDNRDRLPFARFAATLEELKAKQK